MSPETRTAIAREVVAFATGIVPHLDGFGPCLPVACRAVSVAERYGVRLVLQAGTATWPILAPGEDDGVRPTHFTFAWDPREPRSAAAIRNGALPEVHVWAGDPERQELLDATTWALPDLCARLAGLTWSGPRPPVYWWGSARDLPDGWGYDANRDATLYCYELALRAGMITTRRTR